jgi:pimeloyl-ACP methyl ester carboxylesterase
MSASAEVISRDGRRLGVHVLAEGASGRTVVLCHPAPGSGAFDPDPEQTRARGVTLVAVDRPGYGGSDPVGEESWATVAGAAADIVDVLTALGLGGAAGTADAPSVGAAGWSAGGRVALALAALRPDLVDRVVAIATPAPDEEVPWIPPEQRAGLEALRDAPAGVAHRALREQLAGLVPADPADALPLLGAGPADADVLARADVRARLATMLEVAFTQGAAGLAADIAGYTLRPWGFTPAEVPAKVLVLSGAADPVAGPRHGTWYQRHLPDARYEQSPGHGHLLVVPVWKRTLSHLAPHHRR